MAYEAERQWEVWRETGQRLGQVPKQTRGWDDVENITRGQRHKEESSDYRYFPDPDLVPVTVPAEKVERFAHGMGELPAALRERLETTYGITPYDSDVLVNQGQPTVDVLSGRWPSGCGDGKLASNWLQQDVLRLLKEKWLSIETVPGPPGRHWSSYCRKFEPATSIPRAAAKCWPSMVESGRSAAEVMQAMGIEKVDESRLVELCQRTGRGQSQARGRRQSRQNASRRSVCRPGQKEEPQRQSRPRPRNLPRK